MVDSVNPSAPSYYTAGNPPPTPSNGMFYSMTDLWALFSSYNNGQYGTNTPVNTPHYLGMLVSAIKNVMTEFGNQAPNPNTDPSAYAVYEDLTKTLFSGGGNYYSLASIAQEPIATALQDLSTDWTPIVLPQITQLNSDVVSWFPAHYPSGSSSEPPNQMPPGLSADFATLLSSLSYLQQHSHDPTCAPAVMQAITSLQTLLNTPGTILDGYGLFLQSYLNAPLTSDGTTSLVSLAANLQDPVSFMNGILDAPASGPSPADEIQEWLSGIMHLEFQN